MKRAIIYIHGKNGSADEALHYRPLFPDFDVVGLAYEASTPWEAKKEFSDYFSAINDDYEDISIIANSIGAFFIMNAALDINYNCAYFISPVVDMEKLIRDMMLWAHITEEELQIRKKIETPFGETLSWNYLRYVREHPISWNIPTHILYGENDALTSLETVSAFAEGHGATLHVMPGGEHWFHTEEQMAFLDQWITEMQRRK